MPKEVQLNTPVEYSIKVTNLTDMPVTEVVVRERIAENFKLSGASPNATILDDVVVWEMPVLKPKEIVEIKVAGLATDSKCLKHCATVSYVIPSCANVKVVQPVLRLEKTAPAEVLLCDPIPIKLVVTNPGTGTASNVRIEDPLPNGLSTSEGQTSLSWDVGTLRAGQSKEFSAMLKAAKTGKYVNKATAGGAGGIKAQSAPVETIVRQPVLAITKTGPERRYLGRPVSYLMQVSNKGDAVAENMILEDTIPSGMKFVSANHGGVERGGKVVWNLPPLPPNESHMVEVSYSTEQEGTFTNRATVKADCTGAVSASAKTAFKGIAAILLEVVDVEDPIELGSFETYVITATNQGTTAGTNISIVCTLEDNAQYYSASGPTNVLVKGNQVSFAPLASLAPKNTATWKVVVKAVKVGDVRFRVAMNSDQLGRPVDETESTEMYE